MKINKIYVFVIIFVLLSMKIFAGDSGEITKIRDLGLNDFRIYKSKDEYISLDMSHKKIEEIFGEPVKTKVIKNKYESDNDELEYVYDGVEIYFYKKVDKVTYIYVTKNNYFTTRGIYIGSSVESVKKIYNIDKIFPDGSMLSQYYTEDGTLRVFNIAFEVKEDKVSSIILEVASDI